MRRWIVTGLGGVALAASMAAASASAGVATFDSLRSSFTLPAMGSTYVEAGLTFYAQKETGPPEQLATWGYADAGLIYNADPAGAAIWVNAHTAQLSLLKADLSTFTLNSLDLADYVNAALPLNTYDMRYRYADLDGAHEGIFHLDHAAGLQTFTVCLLYTSPSPRDRQKSRMPSSA